MPAILDSFSTSVFNDHIGGATEWWGFPSVQVDLFERLTIEFVISIPQLALDINSMANLTSQQLYGDFQQSRCLSDKP